MKVLVLGPHVEVIGSLLDGASLRATEDPLTVKDAEGPSRADLLVSYGYGHIVRQDVLDAVGGQAINLHISLLPWNRGADPNLWSWLENTPKGISIHWVTSGLDKGPLVAQRPVEIGSEETLRSSYAILQGQIVALLGDLWPLLRTGNAPTAGQGQGGTYHAAADKDAHAKALPRGWDTPCGIVRDYGRRAGLWVD